MGQTTSRNLQFHIISDKTEAQRLLDGAENKDFYLEECRDDDMNNRARSYGSYVARGMTIQEHKFFEVVTENAKDKLPKRLQHELSSVHLIQLEPTAEGGMPHTRPDTVICYPDITSTFSITTLIHELWHVHQRQNDQWWSSVFSHLGWKPWTEGIPQRLEACRRFNPDTIDSPLWCYQQTWVPIPIFRDIAKPIVGRADIWFYHVTLKYHVKSPPKEMEAMYHSLPLSAYEHPREMVAYLLSDPITYSECPALGPLIEAVGAISLPSE